jgi:hypothetical protein
MAQEREHHRDGIKHGVMLRETTQTTADREG